MRSVGSCGMADWFARPVLHVADVAASVRFYVDRLGFTSPWHYDEGGAPVVAQVERSTCALILSSHWPAKVGTGLVFVSLGDAAAVDAVRAELAGNGATVTEASWGYRVLVVADPDGNELYFNYPDP
jgi:catechol 2,3-dioxygenase-like lactoylglutathione lyase family enzyme